MPVRDYAAAREADAEADACRLAVYDILYERYERGPEWVPTCILDIEAALAEDWSSDDVYAACERLADDGTATAYQGDWELTGDGIEYGPGSGADDGR